MPGEETETVRVVTHIAIVQVEGLVGEGATRSKSFDSYDLAEDWVTQTVCEEGGAETVDSTEDTFGNRQEIVKFTAAETPVSGYVIKV